MTTCKICGHSKDEHKVHVGPDHTGRKINHVGCRFIVKREPFDLGIGGVTSIGTNCSCDGFRPNTSLKRALKKYAKYLKENKATISEYKLKQIRDVMRYFRKSIKENPKNLLHWQLEEAQS